MTVKPRNYISVASIALFLGGLLWIAAFWFPVFKTAEREIAGYWVFVSGWMGFVVFQFAWYANLLLLIAVILMYTAPVRATVFAAVGLLAATQAFWFDVLPETTESVVITAKGLGFWFWYAGIFLMSVGVFFCLDSDEVTDVIETPEADVDAKPSHTKVLINLSEEQPAEQAAPAAAVSQPDYNPFIAAEAGPVEQAAQTEAVRQSDYNPFIEAEAGPFERPIVEETPLPPPPPATGNPFYADPAPSSATGNPFHNDDVAPAAPAAGTNLAEVDPEPEILPEIAAKEVVFEVADSGVVDVVLAETTLELPAPEAESEPEPEVMLPVADEPELAATGAEEAVPAEAPEQAPEPFVLNKTDEELEATVPVVTAILQDAVFPEIKKPE